MTLASLADAIAWLTGPPTYPWRQQRDYPLRLNVDDTEGELGGLRFHPAFERFLSRSPYATEQVVSSDVCFHPRVLPGQQCPDCFGLGVRERSRVVWVWPMTAALARLEKCRPLAGVPPVSIVGILAAAGWDHRRAAAVVHRDPATFEAMALSALRALHSRYSSGPLPRVGWVSKSDSQRAAEDAA